MSNKQCFFCISKNNVLEMCLNFQPEGINVESSEPICDNCSTVLGALFNMLEKGKSAELAKRIKPQHAVGVCGSNLLN